jgi:hypothetical protein
LGRNEVRETRGTVPAPAAPGVHLLAAVTHQTGTVAAQRLVPIGASEIAGFTPPLDPIDLTGVVLTADALHHPRPYLTSTASRICGPDVAARLHPAVTVRLFVCLPFWEARVQGSSLMMECMQGRLYQPPGSEPARSRAEVTDPVRPTAASVESIAAVAGNAAISRFLAGSRPVTVQRSGTVMSAETQLAAVQGNAMYGLLPELASMPPSVLDDRTAARQVGGDRLVLAIEAMQAKGKQAWIEFAQQRSARLAQLPADQVTDIIRYLGAPADARYYTRQFFNQNYDGVVDPAKGEVLLIFKVKFFFEESSRVNVAPLQTGFPAGFKKAVEETWSGKGTCQLPGPDGTKRAFATRVQVDVTPDPHYTFQVSIIPKGRVSVTDKDKHSGGLDYHDNEPRKHSEDFPSPGGKTVHTETEQITSAHEAGHAFGLDHVNGSGDASKDYAGRPEHAPDIMGLGNKVMVQSTPKGQITHNDFAPFEAIADKWRKELYPGALEAQCR